MNVKKQPDLFRMVRRGYDPDEVLDCLLSVIDIIRTLQTRLMTERDAIYRECLQARTDAEEGKECVRRLERELQEALQENGRLRTLYGQEHKSDSVPGEAAESGFPLPSVELEDPSWIF